MLSAPIIRRPALSDAPLIRRRVQERLHEDGHVLAFAGAGQRSAFDGAGADVIFRSARQNHSFVTRFDHVFV